MNFLDKYRPKVEDEIRLCLTMPTPPLLDPNTINCYHMGFCDRYGNPSDSSKGKYLRPLFCIAMCAGLGGDPEQAIPLAAALEIIHRTTLIFDDIEDKGEERNNRPTVWATWGVEQAINAGLALSCYARLAIHRLSLRNVPDNKVLAVESVLEKAVIDLCQGQFMDISFVDSPKVSPDDYLEMIRGKTAALFATSCAAGAMLASPDPGKVQAAWEFGLNIGMAFQIRDDYLGIWGDEALVGKTANDILERKRSLPMVMAIQLFPDEEVTLRKTIINWLDAAYMTKEVAAAIKIWMEQKAIPERVKSYEERFIKRARDNMEELSLGQEWRDHFEGVFSFLSEREI